MSIVESDNIDDYYAEALSREIGEHIEITNKIPNSVYKGELGYAMMTSCVTRDTPPSSFLHEYVIEDDENKYNFFYKIKITQIEHDLLMLILTSINSIMPITEFSKVPIGPKRSRIQKELTAMGIGHMGKWITCNKDKTYTLEIRYLTYKQSSMISKSIFGC